MKVRANFIVNKKVLKNLEQVQKKALLLTVEALKTDVETSQIVPKQTGEMERSGFVDDSELERFVVSLVYDTPYARRLYWHPEYDFRKDKNPNAQGKWLEPYISGEKKDFVKKTFAFFLKQEAKGLIK